MSTRKACLLAGLVAISLSSFNAAWSQEKYPSRPVRIVVALGPGSGADALARFLAADPLRRELQTEVIVDNKPGAGGVLGGLYVFLGGVVDDVDQTEASRWVGNPVTVLPPREGEAGS